MTNSSDKSPRRELLEEAADLIDGDRNVTYGSPTQNFQNIADMWTTRFAHMLKEGESFTAVDVADAMILVKVARNIANVKRDNFADIAGYAGCGYEASLTETQDKHRSSGGYVEINMAPGTSAQDIVEGIITELRRRPATGAL